MARRKSYKGCCMLCALGKGTFKNNSKARIPWSTKRQLGQARRFSG